MRYRSRPGGIRTVLGSAPPGARRSTTSIRIPPTKLVTRAQRSHPRRSASISDACSVRTTTAIRPDEAQAALDALAERGIVLLTDYCLAISDAERRCLVGRALSRRCYRCRL